MSAARVSAGLSQLADLVLASRELSPRIAALAGRYAEVLRAGRTLFFCGNGGSAADAQHLAAEYVVRYNRARPGLAAIALTTDSSILTAAGNDLGFEQIFARQVEALARPGDLLVLHSTSGRSPNLLTAARAARARSVGTAAFLGRGGGPLAAEVDDAIVVASDDTSRIQLLHLALEHMIVELVEAELLPER
jgi:D-sedoheptulose 7-phosphate isomerase